MLGLSTIKNIFDHLEGSENDWEQAIQSLAQVLRSWSTVILLTRGDMTRLKIVRRDLSFRLAIEDRRASESNEQYLNDMEDVGNALAGLEPGPTKAGRDQLFEVLGVVRWRELASLTAFSQSVNLMNTADQELATMRRRVGEVDNAFETNIWSQEILWLHKELRTSVMDILEKDIARVQGKASYLDLDVQYRGRIIELHRH